MYSELARACRCGLVGCGGWLDVCYCSEFEAFRRVGAWVASGLMRIAGKSFSISSMLYSIPSTCSDTVSDFAPYLTAWSCLSLFTLFIS